MHFEHSPTIYSVAEAVCWGLSATNKPSRHVCTAPYAPSSRVANAIRPRHNSRAVVEKILRHCGLWEGPLRTLATARSPPGSGDLARESAEPRELRSMLDPASPRRQPAPENRRKAPSKHCDRGSGGLKFISIATNQLSLPNPKQRSPRRNEGA